MRLAMAGKIDDDFLAFARQIAATDIIVVGSTSLPADIGHYRFRDLLLLRKQIEDAGLTCAAIEGSPADWTDKIKLDCRAGTSR